MITLAVITTNRKSRLTFLNNVVETFEAHNAGLVSKTIMSVDLLPESNVKAEYFKSKYGPLGYKVTAGPCNGKYGLVSNQKRAMALVETEWVLYTEDDIQFRHVLTPAEFEALRAIRVDGRPVGFACCNTHVHRRKEVALQRINNKDGYIKLSDNVVFLPKAEAPRDSFHLSFPVSLFPVELLRNLHAHSAEHRRDRPLEKGLTEAWFDLSYHKQYCVGTLSFATVLPKLGRLDQNKFNNYALIDFWNNNKAMQPPSISPENIFLG